MTNSLVAEVAKVLIQGAFNYMRTQGLSQEEADALFEKEAEQFRKNDPGNLPDPT